MWKFSVAEISNSKFFCIFFCFSAASAILIQFIILPLLLPHLHGGHGLMAGLDSLAFHKIAVQMSNAMHEQGWSQWELMKATNGGSPPGIAAFFYYLTVPEPFVLIPFNSAVHALSALLVMLVCKSCLGGPKFAFLGAIPFLVLPSAANWYAQIHRDGYCFLGFFLILHGWICLAAIANWKIPWRNGLLVLSEFVFGTLFLWLAREYILQLLVTLFPFMILTLSARIIYLFSKQHLSFSTALIGILLCLISPFLGEPIKTKSYAEPVPEYQFGSGSNPQFVNEKHVWHSSGLPNWLEVRFSRVADERNSSRYSPIVSNKNPIDIEVKFSRVFDVIAYLPRALQIAYLSPFPNTWLTKKNRGFMKLIATGEMLIVYLGLALLLVNIRALVHRVPFWLTLFFCTAPLAIYGLSVTNLGALYRYRYGYLMLMVGLGYCSGIQFFLSKKKFSHLVPFSKTSK